MILRKPVLLACFFAFLAGFLIVKVYDPDVWLHLHIGRFILETRSIPDVNTFSLTQAQFPWIPHEWLAGIALYWFFSHWGLIGLTLLQAIVFCSAALLVLSTVETDDVGWLAIAGLTLAVLGVNYRFGIRPEMFSALFLCAYLFVLERWQRGKPSRLWVLLPIQALWVNMHGYFIIGPALIFIFWIGTQAQLSSKRSRQLLLSGLLSVGACLLNPQFVRGLLRPILVLPHMLGDWGISEWMPPFPSFSAFFHGPWSHPGKLFIVISAASFAANWKKFQLRHLLVWAVFLVGYLRSTRNILFFAIAGMPALISNFREAAAQREALARKAAPILELGLAIFLVAAAYDALSGRYFIREMKFRERGFGLSTLYLPFDACDFIEAAGLTGPFFNDYDIGNYLLWRFPQRKVFIDGRDGEAYGSDWLAVYHGALSGAIPPEELSRRYGLNFFLLNHLSGSARPLIQALNKNPLWAPAYIDHNSVIFARREKRWLAPVIRSPGEPALKADSPWATAIKHFNLAKILSELGWVEKAAQHGERGLRLYPGSFEARCNLAKQYAALGRYEQAIRHYQEAARLKPESELPRNQLVALFFQRGQRKLQDRRHPDALEDFRRAAALNDTVSVIHKAMGVCLFRLGRHSESIVQFKRAIELDPSDAEAIKNLANVVIATSTPRSAPDSAHRAKP